MSLILSGVSKNYQQAQTRIEVLKNLSLKVATGEVVAILGPSGSGKSTLLSLLSGLDAPTSGQLEVQGVQLDQLTEEEITDFRGKNIGIVFQQFHLMSHLTALENVLLPLEINGDFNSSERAAELLRQVGLGDRQHHFPSQLSGGECQRVAIARSLIHAPKLLLADEPSGNLDVGTGAKVMDLFFDLVRKHKTTTVLVTHSEELAARCDRRFRLSAGQLSLID